MSAQSFDFFPMGKAEACHVSMNSSFTQLNNNILVVGGSGSGKTVSVLDPMLLHLKHGNAVSVFTKHSQRSDELQALLTKRGYRVFVMDFTKPRACRYGYDPLRYCRSDEDIRDLATTIVCNGHDTSWSKDPYWDNAAISLLSTVLRYVHDGHYYGGRTMTAALELLDSIPFTDDWGSEPAPQQAAGQEAGEEAPQVDRSDELMWQELPHLYDVDPLGRTTWQTLLVNNADNTKACVQSSLVSPLVKLFTHSVREIVNKPVPFDFAHLLEPKTVLFIYTLPANPALNMFISIFYRQLFQYLFEAADERPEHVLPQPVYVCCDDFATGCKIPDFPQLISIFREKGISVTLLVQSESQLEGLYGLNCTLCQGHIFRGGPFFWTPL